jgi:hypothetical protein
MYSLGLAYMFVKKIIKFHSSHIIKYTSGPHHTLQIKLK